MPYNKNMYTLSQTHKKKLIIAYVFFLILGFFFVRASLNDDSVKLEDKEKQEEGVEVKPVKVYLEVHVQDSVIEYKARMNKVDTVLDLFEHLRTKENFWYEKEAYTYGTEINDVLSVPSPEGQKWRVFLVDEELGTEKDITFEIGNLNLVDDAVYVVKLVDIVRVIE